MITSYRIKESCLVFLFLILFSSFPGILFSQITVFERPSNNDQKDIGLYSESPTRKKIDLNGQWEISFNEGKSYDKFIIPIAFNFKKQVIFRKKINIPEEMLSSFSFIFQAEGIDYESEIKINNNFVAKHSGGYTPIINPLSDGILSSSNEIVIVVSNDLNFKNTVPLSDQINYSKVYGGITKDIYLIAVPKLFVLSSYVRYSVDNLLSVRIKNSSDIKSANLSKYLDSSQSKEFFVQTKIFRKSNNTEAGQSDKSVFSIGDNNTVRVLNEFTINNPVLWTPEFPELYIARTIISTAKDVIIDELNIETGFTNLTQKNAQIFMSGKQIRLNGINYYEDQPKLGSALSFNDVERDLKNIKTLGFNSVRVPGRCAHPYIVNVCNRLGLFLLQEIPFNELAVHYIDEEKYTRQSLNYLSDIIQRDKNSPCIFAWGIGNDFDVSKASSLSYVKSAAALIDSLDKRFKYYTSRAYNTDICSGEVDFVGINFYETKSEQIKNAVSDISNKSKPVSNRKNNNLFVSYYGLNIENGNSNGFSDPRSQESQMKFLN